MPESKKLSELINVLIHLSNKFSVSYKDCNDDLGDISKKIKEINNQIDQKFEELKDNKIGLLNEACLKQFEEDEKWRDLEEIISNRIKSEYEKHSELILPNEIWIIIAAKKIISSLKEYDVDLSRDKAIGKANCAISLGDTIYPHNIDPIEICKICNKEIDRKGGRGHVCSVLCQANHCKGCGV